jgi:hypothetical protein
MSASKPTSIDNAPAANVRIPPMLLKKSLLRCGKSFDSLNYEVMGGFRHDGQARGTGAAILRL